MNGGWVFLIILILAVGGGYGGWVLWSRRRANKLGLPPPSLNPFARSSAPAPNYPGPAPTGLKGWFDAQIHKFKNRNNRHATGAYEENANAPAGGYARGRGGVGNRFDPDEAWDARVGNEAYYEEQELGLHAPQSQGANPYAASTSYGAPSPGFAGAHNEPERGRSRTREYDEHNDGLAPSAAARDNPFGDEHAATSLRGVSPRPLDHGQDTSYGGAASASASAAAAPRAHKKPGSVNSVENSPTESRRSIFKENM